MFLLSVGRYGPRDRLLLCRGASDPVLVTHKALGGCLGELQLLGLVASLFAGCHLNEGAGESSSRQAITPARYDEGTHATNHNSATGERGYQNTSPP